MKSGSLPGYGIPADKRTRWYVYLDALPTGDVGDDLHEQANELTSTLRSIRDRLGVIQKQRRDSRRVLLDAYDAASFDANETVQELLRTINDSERRNFALDDEISDARDTVIALLDRLQCKGDGP